MAIALDEQARPAKARGNLQPLQPLQHDGGSVATGLRNVLEKSDGIRKALHVDIHVDHRPVKMQVPHRSHS
jgi:hypothetical protein